MTISLQIPPRNEGALSKEWTDLPRKALEAVALEGCRQGALSVGQVGELLGLGFAESEALLKSHGVPLVVDAGDLEADLCLVRSPVSTVERHAGSAAGQVWMADDFDAPLDDLAEYGPLHQGPPASLNAAW